MVQVSRTHIAILLLTIRTDKATDTFVSLVIIFGQIPQRNQQRSHPMGAITQLSEGSFEIPMQTCCPIFKFLQLQSM